ncbi:hypothetical protein A4X09_0g5054 [Tilletia walkeri]|uniref:Uncharacterized protein n=1 Tax=Tilletia walkeri TaxID=117179 RepID=A0A8X7N621_9BASI|nr:hypothetical protein A4X09_0g5054 [Tilletia walkeri]
MVAKVVIANVFPASSFAIPNTRQALFTPSSNTASVISSSSPSPLPTLTLAVTITVRAALPRLPDPPSPLLPLMHRIARSKIQSSAT